MLKFTAKALCLTAVCCVSMGVASQTIYKCGASYSQTPCPGGTLIDVTDTRTPAQKKQTDTAANRDAHAAERMEKSRILQEKTDLAANTPPAPPPPRIKTGPTLPNKVKKVKTPDHFIAQAAGEEKKKPAAKKTTDKTAATPGHNGK